MLLTIYLDFSQTKQIKMNEKSSLHCNRKCVTLENAVEFVKKEGHKYKVITLAGDTIERNGRIVGVGKNHD